MNLANEISSDHLPDENSSLNSILQKLIFKLQNPLLENSDLKAEIELLDKYLSTLKSSIQADEINLLLPVLDKIPIGSSSQLYSLLKVLIPKINEPWSFLKNLLLSSNEQIVSIGLEVLNLIHIKEIINIDERVFQFFADKQETENSPLNTEEALTKITSIFSLNLNESSDNSGEFFFNIYTNSKDIKSRILAAKLLDLKKIPASQIAAERICGLEASKIIFPYLAYTRVTHLDLIYLSPEISDLPVILDSLQKCEEKCGVQLTKEIITKLGWKQVNHGFSVIHYIGLSIKDSLPFFLTESEAQLFKNSADIQEISEFYVFTAYGRQFIETDKSNGQTNAISLFRSYNFAHANLLREILDVAPLTLQKVKEIIEQLDGIVDNFITLFKSYTEECEILSGVYEAIKNKVLKDLECNKNQTHLSADATRLVQMFEDPHSIGEVHTLHGLKRYLHQKGLQLGFKLVDQSRSPNQSVNIVLASDSNILSIINNINFADFESAEKFSISNVPYPIKVVIDGFIRQLLYGQDRFPSVNIYCYGNEIHYFVWFRNHPIFIRIDFSPPLQGGMIDLQYFGVSNYELADHPNLNLDALKLFFNQLEFDVQMKGTHIHARYDKERALNLSQLCERAEYLFCLAAYLMDLDWIIGSLSLTDEAKLKVAKAWAEIFNKWGTLPIKRLLTKDKLSIVKNTIDSAEGELEVIWNGEGNYQDRFSYQLPQSIFIDISKSLSAFNFHVLGFSEISADQFGQIYLENKLLDHLRESLREGEIFETEEGFNRTNDNLFQRINEVVHFAEIIAHNNKNLETSAALAQTIIPLEQILKFNTIGKIESFKVQTSKLDLRGNNLTICVLRDSKEIIRLAFFVRGNLIYKKREGINDDWNSNVRYSPAELNTILRNNNYATKVSVSSIDLATEELKNFQNEIITKQNTISHALSHGEKIIEGLRASPGRAVGKVLLGINQRAPQDFDDHVFVAASISPDDNAYLFHSAGVVATCGGILSHAGLIATQFNKPAIIISGRWIQEPTGSFILIYNTTTFLVNQSKVENLNICIYYDFQQREYIMHEGDLVVLNADEGYLQVLGQEREVISLYEGLKILGRTNENINQVNDSKEILALRGKKIHVRHQLEKLLNQLSNPSLIKFVIEEILIGKFLAENKSSPEEKAFLLNLLLKNKKLGQMANDILIQMNNEIEYKFLFIYEQSIRDIPRANYPFEVVMYRLRVLKFLNLIKNVTESLKNSMLYETNIKMPDINEIDSLSIHRLHEQRNFLFEKMLKTKNIIEKKELLRHNIKQLKMINSLLDLDLNEQPEIIKVQSEIEHLDKLNYQNLIHKYILTSDDGAHDLFPLIGWKAANLAEIEKFASRGLVPKWFAISNAAFQLALQLPIRENISISTSKIIRGTPLFDAIDTLLSINDINSREKSVLIRSLWHQISLPDDLTSEIFIEYRKMENDFSQFKKENKNENEFFVAMRSSSCEEDTESAARAGEFETYLFIRGEDLLIKYLKNTWSGLWTERAIHNRAVFGYQKNRPSGGVIVQRIIWSRVSGVLQTINVAKDDLKEMIINAGLGLGEGVVSGAVAADQITVSKEGDLEKGPLNFNYITADKMEQSIFNKRAGFGTVLNPTLYHQRFRPAMEYVELCELVALATRLESEYGCPLDIEFGIEATKLWILQVRPIPSSLSALTETLNNYRLRNKSNKIL